MALEIREVRRAELDAAFELARSAGSELEPGEVTPALSVSAHRDGQLLAVLLGVYVRGVNHRMELCVGEPCADGSQIGRALVDAALAKSRSRGIAKSRLQVRNARGEQALWDGAQWQSSEPSG